MSTRTCPVCGARWIFDQLYWSTGKKAEEKDLNALVCRNLTAEKAERCVNPTKGQDGGIGWAERLKIIEQGLDGL